MANNKQIEAILKALLVQMSNGESDDDSNEPILTPKRGPGRSKGVSPRIAMGSVKGNVRPTGKPAKAKRPQRPPAELMDHCRIFEHHKGHKAYCEIVSFDAEGEPLSGRAREDDRKLNALREAMHLAPGFRFMPANSEGTVPNRWRGKIENLPVKLKSIAIEPSYFAIEE